MSNDHIISSVILFYLILIIATIMNRITEEFKKNLVERYHFSQQEESKGRTNSTQAYFTNTEEKFMMHFEQINKNTTTNKVESHPMPEYEKKFARTIEDYSTKNSFIDEVINFNEDVLQISHTNLRFCESPSLPKMKNGLTENLKSIEMFFKSSSLTNQSQASKSDVMQIETFATTLSSLGRRNRKPVIKLPNLTSPIKSLKEMQVDTVELQELQREQSQRIKKIDLILMELIREKKRKNYVNDYFNSMEMKLMELLDYILLDQPEYLGLDPSTKTKQVLKNLESFQGKAIQGESKINLLRIFFEEFTSLKKQKEQSQSTPMKKVQNKQKTSTSTKPVSKGNSQPNKKTAKGKRQQTHENSRTEKRSNKSNKPDQWIGSLN